MTTEKSRPMATSAESRSLLNQADIARLSQRISAGEKILKRFCNQTVKKINSINETCEKLTRLFTQHGGN